MLRNRAYSGLSLALALAAGSAATACGPSSQASEPGEANDEFIKVVNVEVELVARRDFTTYIRLTGEVEAMNDVTLSAEEAGVVERFFVEKGAFVREGAAIAKIQDRVLRTQLEEARAAARLAQERYERQRRLWEEEEIGSEIAYLEAKYQAELQTARLENLQARVDRTTVAAPITGIFDARYVDAGEMVAPGTEVGRILEVGRLKVTGGVAERFAATVNTGDSARITLDVLPDREFVGRIGYVGRAVDTRSRTFPIEIVMENPGRVVKPHMVANVEIANRRVRDVIVVPQSALMRTEAGYQAFVATESDGDLVATARIVRLGPAYANRTVVLEGLETGDRLIIRGQQLVEASDHLRIVNLSEIESAISEN